MKSMEKLRDQLCDLLDEVTESGELNTGTLDTADKIVHAIKCIDTIMAMESASYDDGSYDDRSYNDRSYNDRSYNDRSYDNSYADNRGRGSNARRDSMGRYSSRGYSRRYSRDDKEHMTERIEDMMQEASNPEVKEALRKVLHVMK